MAPNAPGPRPSAAPEAFPCPSDGLRIDGPSGALEAQTSCPAERAVDAVAVVCHPHPLHGGTMQNKVVHYLARTLNELGLRVVRFNFRGVGASGGHYGGGTGEQEDLRAVLDWARRRQPGAELWLAGFSFGAYVALREAARGGVQRLITVAPPVHGFDSGDLAVPTCPWLLVQGTADEVVPAEEVLRWAETRTPRPDIAVLPGVDHFFHGQLTTLRSVLLEHLGPAVTRLRQTP